MPYNALAQNIFGTIGTICWTLQVVPQIWKSWRTKSTTGLSAALLFIWGVSALPLGTYAIVQNINIPLIVQPQLFCALCLVSWAQCQYYGQKRPLYICVLMYVALLAVIGGLEAGLVVIIRPVYARGNDTPVTVLGITSSVLIGSGLLPQYYEIWKHKEVIGLSIPFMLIDLAGGIFNDLSLVFKREFDVLAGACYSIVVVMDAVVIIAALVLNPRAKRRRAAEAEAEAAAEGSTVDGEATPRNTSSRTDVEKAADDAAERGAADVSTDADAKSERRSASVDDQPTAR